eukprot:TRINITY_DN9463_c0_g1_i1.p1 TRINITY_DN9463_c0_g1~~TRINITY_DN9463_c0_g1_i1.p1  ORF type:complete len:197 (+),score=44.98 TRINITY_DN9463_c0_g1_i1:133-723(+)
MQFESDNNTLKVVVLGAGGVGKSAITVQFVQNLFLEKYDPTIEDSYRAILEHEGEVFTLEILDTAGTEQFRAMRDLYMKTGAGFLIIYSIISQATFDEVEEIKAKIDIVKDGHATPIVLVGNKRDLEAKRVISKQAGESAAASWGETACFKEITATQRNEVADVFHSLVDLMQKQAPKTTTHKTRRQKIRNNCSLF